MVAGGVEAGAVKLLFAVRRDERRRYRLSSVRNRGIKGEWEGRVQSVDARSVAGKTPEERQLRRPSLRGLSHPQALKRERHSEGLYLLGSAKK